MYDFRKIYADLVAEDGTVCIVYRTWVRLFRAWHERSGFELHAPDGTRTVHLGARTSAPPEPDAPLAALPLRLGTGGDGVELTIEEEHGGFDPGPACEGLSWSVKLGAGRVRARGPGFDLRGRGYVDLVRLTRITRRLGMRQLAWGRAHAGEATFVWTALDFADGRAFRAGARWDGGTRAEGGLEVGIDRGGAGIVSVAGRSLALEAGRVLWDGDAFDRARIPSAFDRLVTRAVGGPTHQLRWLGRATDHETGTSGDALYERVRFGRAHGPAEGGGVTPTSSRDT
jgi:hypothetical protein